jgi:hypothetical protein
MNADYSSLQAAPVSQNAPTFAPRPQASALSSTPILTQQIPEEEPEVIRLVANQGIYDGLAK